MKLFGTHANVLGMVIVAFLLLIFGEITPKTIAVNSPEGVSRLVIVPLHYFSRIITPVRLVLVWLRRALLPDKNLKKNRYPFTF